MRTIMAYGVLMVLVAVGAEAQNAVAPATHPVTDETIINLCGGRLAKMFTRCGTPEDVYAIRGDTPAEDDVLCEYGTYSFRVRDKVIRTCFFATDWKGPIRGIKIGDSRQDVVKVLGAAPTTFTDKNGVVTAYGYVLKDLDVKFFTNFDKDGKVWRVEVSLK